MSSTASTPPKLRTLLRLFLPVFQFLQHESSSEVVTHAQSTFPQPRWFPRQHRGFIIHHAIFLFHSTPFNASIQLHISPTASTSGGAVSTMLSGVCVLCDVAPFAADTVYLQFIPQRACLHMFAAAHCFSLLLLQPLSHIGPWHEQTSRRGDIFSAPIPHRNFIRSLLCLTMHLFHAEFDFFSSNQGWCGIAIGPKQYVVVQCQHGSNIGFVEGLGVTGDHCTLQAAVVAFRQICFFIDRVPESQYSPRRFIQKAHEGVVIHDRAERPPRGSSSRFPPALPIRAFAGLATKDGC